MLMGDGAEIPWRLLHIEFLMEDYETGGNKQFHYNKKNKFKLTFLNIYCFCFLDFCKLTFYFFVTVIESYC